MSTNFKITVTTTENVKRVFIAHGYHLLENKLSISMSPNHQVIFLLHSVKEVDIVAEKK